MMHLLAERLVWAALGGFLFTVLALGLGRVPSLHPAAKVWLCRAAAVKFLAALVWTVPISIRADAGAANPSDTLVQFLLGAWVVGALAVASAAFIAWRDAARIRAFSQPAVVQDIPGVQVRVLPGAAQPCVIGVLRPCLILPATSDTDPAILAHELAHIRHRDLAWNAVLWLVYCLFWFVPGLGRLVRECSLWQEASADAAARQESRISAGAQARLLLETLDHSRASWATASFSGEGSQAARRIQAMFQSRHSRTAAAVALTLALLTSVPLQPKASAGRAGHAAYASSGAVALRVASPGN